MRSRTDVSTSLMRRKINKNVKGEGVSSPLFVIAKGLWVGLALFVPNVNKLSEKIKADCGKIM